MIHDRRVHNSRKDKASVLEHIVLALTGQSGRICTFEGNLPETILILPVNPLYSVVLVAA
jgi:hypothetical protein